MAKIKIDAAVFTAVGQHYIARPQFTGVEDPMPKRSGVIQGETDAVTMPDIPLRKARKSQNSRKKGMPLSMEVWDKIVEWAAENCPGEGERHRYWGAIAGFLYRQGVGAEEVTEIIYEAATAANDEEAKSRADCALRACDAIETGQLMTGIPTLIEEFDIENINEITEMLGTNKTGIGDMIENLSQNYDEEELSEILVKVKALPVVSQEKYLRSIKDKTNIGMTKLRDALKTIRNDSGLPEEIYDLGAMTTNEVLLRHYDGGETLIRTSGRNFFYNGRSWEDEPMDYIAGLIIPWAKEFLKQYDEDKNLDALVREALNLIKWTCARKGDAMRTLEYPYPVVNALNAEIWLNKDGSYDPLPHNPDSFQLGHLNVAYDPDATCEHFDKALLEIFEDTGEAEEMRRHFYEFIGYVIQPYHDIPAFGIWKGQSTTGKSKLAETLARLIGYEGVIHLKLESLARDKDSLGNLLGKRLIIEDELAYGVEFPDGIIKMISELKRITSELKFVNKFSFVNYATPLLIGNYWPKILVSDPSIERRAVIFPFTRRFTDDEDTELFPKIWQDPQEMSGILNQALKGCQRLRENKNRFNPPKTCKLAYDDWTSGCSFATVFLDEICEPNPEGPNQLWKDHVQLFYDWAEERGVNVQISSSDLRRIYEGKGVKFGSTGGEATVKGFKAPDPPM